MLKFIEKYSNRHHVCLESHDGSFNGRDDCDISITPEQFQMLSTRVNLKFYTHVQNLVNHLGLEKSIIGLWLVKMVNLIELLQRVSCFHFRATGTINFSWKSDGEFHLRCGYYGFMNINDSYRLIMSTSYAQYPDADRVKPQITQKDLSDKPLALRLLESSTRCVMVFTTSFPRNCFW